MSTLVFSDVAFANMGDSQLTVSGGALFLYNTMEVIFQHVRFMNCFAMRGAAAILKPRIILLLNVQPIVLLNVTTQACISSAEEDSIIKVIDTKISVQDR